MEQKTAVEHFTSKQTHTHTRSYLKKYFGSKLD